MSGRSSRLRFRWSLAAASFVLGACDGGDSHRATVPPAPPGAAPGAALPEAASPDGEADAQFAADRRRMVESLREVVKDQRVLEVLARVPRHEFVPPPQRARSYANTTLPISESQTISAPDIVAIMTAALALRPGDRVLEIGTGSGYQAAVLGELASEVYSVEIRPALARSARSSLERLRKAGKLRAGKIEVVEGDGFQGYPAAAPYDAIIVTAAPRQVPTELLNQLKPGGRMVIPVGDFYQELQLIEKRLDAQDGKEKLTTRTILPVRFVPMVTPEER